MYYDRKISASMRERRRLACTAELKSVDGEGRFAGYASVFGVLDHQKDIILRGAFTDTIYHRVPQIKLLWQHQPDEPIGVFTSMFEDERGLYVEGKLLLSVARAREALALLKSGAISGLSIGYSPVRYTIEPDGVRKLWEVDLWEVSLVTFPANDQAGVTVVKSAAKKNSTALWQLKHAAERAMNSVAHAALHDSACDTNISPMDMLRMECDRIKVHALLLEIKQHAARALRKDDFEDGEDDAAASDGDGGAGDWNDDPDADTANDSGGGAAGDYGDDAGDQTDDNFDQFNGGGVGTGVTAGVTPGGVSYDDKIQQDMEKRGWTEEQIDNAQQNGPSIDAINRTNGDPFTPATRYVDPDTGRSVVIDDEANQAIQVGEPDFVHSVASGDAPGAVMRPGTLVQSPDVTSGGDGGMGGGMPFDDILHPSRFSNPENLEE